MSMSGLEGGAVRDAVIVAAARTPVGRGRPAGALSGWHPVDLLAETLTAVSERAGIEPARVDDVIVGCVSQGGEQAANVARSAVLAANWPVSVPAVTVDRQCGSSQQALHFAAQAIIAGSCDVVVAAGVESMSRVPMGSPAAGVDPFGARVRDRFTPGLVPQGISAELIAARWGLERDQLDEWSARSHRRAARATADGLLTEELVPVVADRGDGPTGELLNADEGVRADTTVEALARLQPAFADDHWRARFPGISGIVHAGNSSQLSDGAAALMVVEAGLASSLDVTPLARVHAMSVVGDDPVLMLTGIIPATRAVLARAGMRLSDVDAFEVNEAFAPVVLAWLRDLDADPERVNVRGGAIANGHPLGASGAKLTTTLLSVLRQKRGRWGLQTMCEGGGMANATILERLG